MSALISEVLLAQRAPAMDGPGTLVAVEARGFTCWADSLRTVGDGWAHGLALLSVFGPRNAVRAVWARLFESTKGSRRPNEIDVGGEHVRRREGALYATVNTPIGEGLLHTIVIDRAATRGGEEADAFLQVGPDAETRWFSRFQRLCPVPVRPTWGSALWALGVEGGAITPLRGFGVDVWRVVPTQDVWAGLIQGALVAGALA